MKANELRLFNLVNYEDHIVRVISISGYLSLPNSGVFNIETLNSFGGWDNISLFEIEPIKLTEEWLIKFEWQLIGKNMYHINSNFSLDKYCHVYYHSDYTGLNIDYVHQLQNLYFCLTGEELKIN